MPPRSSAALALADALADGGWRSKARPSQLPPPEWEAKGGVWINKGGRGSGKTYSGSNVTNELAETGGAKRIALIGATASDVRDTMIEGESGILATAADWCRPIYEPSKRRLVWPSGAIATAFSSEEPERLRGPQHDFAWCDELAAWTNPKDTWDMMRFGLRVGTSPRALITTTPKPIKLLRELLAMPGIFISGDSTFANADNLAPGFLDAMRERYEGTRLGRQELEAEMLLDADGALWTRQMIDDARLKGASPEFKRVVVAVDPAVSDKENSSETGIVAAGLGTNDRGYLLADRSGRHSPNEWARRAIELYAEHKADRIVAEGNQGGDLVRQTLHSLAPNVPVTIVHASRGKVARAEPIAALYEQKKISHVGQFPELEDQQCTWEPLSGMASPDRIDALVWAFTALMVSKKTPTAAVGRFEWR